MGSAKRRCVDPRTAEICAHLLRGATEACRYGVPGLENAGQNREEPAEDPRERGGLARPIAPCKPFRARQRFVVHSQTHGGCFSRWSEDPRMCSDGLFEIDL